MTMVKKIEDRMSELGIKQADLARAIHVTPQRVSLWMDGTGEPKPKQLLAVARALNVSVEWLADDAMSEVDEGEKLSQEDLLVLKLAREMGVHEAIRRLGLIAPAETARKMGHQQMTRPSLKARS